MDVSGYLRRLDSVKFSETTCPCCSSPVLLGNAINSFCHFCEMFVPQDNRPQVDSASSKILKDANTGIISGDWLGAMAAVKPLEASTNPFVLYGVGSIYMAFSDHVYDSVNYQMGGFMYSNADKRNDEFNKNPNNSMHFLSKAKEMIFSSIYMTNNLKSNDWMYHYLVFSGQMKLKRYAQAHAALGRVNETHGNPVADYAGAVYSVQTGGKGSERRLRPLLANGELNAFYYLARLASGSGDLGGAQRILVKIITKAYMPMAMRLLAKVKEVELATML